MSADGSQRVGRRQMGGSSPSIREDSGINNGSALETDKLLPTSNPTSITRQAMPWLNSSSGQALTSEVVYCLVSAGTTLFNKHALSTYDFPAPNSLLLFQFVLAMLLLEVLRLTRVISLPPLKWELVKMWLPVNLIFVLMNVTGFYALQDIGAGMFTVLKNLSNLMTIAGDYFFYGYTYSWQVWGCLGLMILSALLGGMTDMQFSLRGYAWQLVNCLFTAAYSLYLSGVIRKLLRQQHGKQQLSEISMVYYNNLLSVPPMALLSLCSGELRHLRHAPQLVNHSFQLVAVLGGLLGFGVSFASIWCMSRTSATIYSLTGSMNKVVVAVVGIWQFHERTNWVNLSSIAAGLAAGALFVYAKGSGPINSTGSSGTGSSGGATPSHREVQSPAVDEEAPLVRVLSVTDSFKEDQTSRAVGLNGRRLAFAQGSTGA